MKKNWKAKQEQEQDEFVFNPKTVVYTFGLICQTEKYYVYIGFNEIMQVKTREKLVSYKCYRANNILIFSPLVATPNSLTD